MIRVFKPTYKFLKGCLEGSLTDGVSGPVRQTAFSGISHCDLLRALIGRFLQVCFKRKRFYITVGNFMSEFKTDDREPREIDMLCSPRPERHILLGPPSIWQTLLLFSRPWNKAKTFVLIKVALHRIEPPQTMRYQLGPLRWVLFKIPMRYLPFAKPFRSIVLVLRHFHNMQRFVKNVKYAFLCIYFKQRKNMVTQLLHKFKLLHLNIATIL